MPVFFSARDRKEYLELMGASAERFGLHMNTGRPLGSDRWVKGLERRLPPRRLGTLPVGWPKGKSRKKGK